jgi:hypothetical protein
MNGIAAFNPKQTQISTPNLAKNSKIHKKND